MTPQDGPQHGSVGVPTTGMLEILNPAARLDPSGGGGITGPARDAMSSRYRWDWASLRSSGQRQVHDPGVTSSHQWCGAQSCSSAGGARHPS
jgi:hypothetical protein